MFELGVHTSHVGDTRAAQRLGAPQRERLMEGFRDEEIDRKLEHIMHMLLIVFSNQAVIMDTLGELGKGMVLTMSGLTDLEAAVANEASVEASAVTLIQGIAQKVSDAVAASGAAEDSQLGQLAASINSSASTLAAAVAANTPAAPAPSGGDTSAPTDNGSDAGSGAPDASATPTA